jgi:hypothetical protein
MIDTESLPGQIQRSQTSFGERSTEAESSRTGDSRVLTEPRLITPHIARESSILKLDLNTGKSTFYNALLR